MSNLLYRLGHLAVRRRRTVLLAWLALLVTMIGLASTIGGSTSDAFSIPGTESQRAVDLLDERFPAQSGSDIRVVFAAADGSALTEPATRATVTETLAEIGSQPDVAGVSDPFADGTISPEGTIAFADVHFATTATEVPEEAVEAVRAVAEDADGLQMQFGGEVMDAGGEEPGGSSELIGLAVAVVVLLVSFGSVVAMGCRCSPR